MEFNKQSTSVRSSASEAIIDQGLRAYMLKVYNYMASGVLLTGIISLLVFKFSGGMNITLGPAGFTGLTDPFGELIFNSGFKWLVMLAPLGIVMYLSFGISKMSASKAQSTFWVFAALMGASLASIFIVYTQMTRSNPKLLHDSKCKLLTRRLAQPRLRFTSLVFATPRCLQGRGMFRYVQIHD